MQIYLDNMYQQAIATHISTKIQVCNHTKIRVDEMRRNYGSDGIFIVQPVPTCNECNAKLAKDDDRYIRSVEWWFRNNGKVAK